VNPSEAIEAGRQILDKVMIPAGFEFVHGSIGHGSGGHFASASYTRGNRRLDLSYRWALGAVEYRIDESALDHNAYMRLLGVWAESEYSHFSRDVALAGFEALRHDLECYCSDFLVGPGAEFKRLAREGAAHSNV
jgi:hypothetical protein